MPGTNSAELEGKRAALYAHVSNTDERQNPETRLRLLRDYAERRGFSVAGEYVDQAFGRGGFAH